MKTANENVIRLLARAMSEARAGNVDAVMIVTASPEGQPDASFAGEAELMPTINIGLDLAKQKVLAQVATMVMQPVTSIRRAAGALDS
jgi:hypothetical protein